MACLGDWDPLLGQQKQERDKIQFVFEKNDPGVKVWEDGAGVAWEAATEKATPEVGWKA